MEFHRDAVDIEAFALEVGLREWVVHGKLLFGGRFLASRESLRQKTASAKELSRDPIRPFQRSRLRVPGLPLY